MFTKGVIPIDLSRMDTPEKIRHYAKEEFLQNGYEAATTRNIAGKVGITAGALYKHFRTKEEIFNSLVEPVYKELHRISRILMDDALKEIDGSNFRKFVMASDKANLDTINYVYSHFDEFRLMFNYSAGTKYENIRNMIVNQKVAYGKEFLQVLRKEGIEYNRFNDEQLHMIYSTAFTPLFEIIAHEYPYEKAVQFVGIMTEAMNFGWKLILKA